MGSSHFLRKAGFQRIYDARQVSMESDTPLDRLVLILVIAGAAVWAVVMLGGIVATLPWGLPALILFMIGGYIVYRVIQDRLSNAEDDYYDKNVEQ